MYNKKEKDIFKRVHNISDAIIDVTQVQKSIYLKFKPDTTDDEIEAIWNNAKGRLNLRVYEIKLRKAGIFDRLNFETYKNVRLGRY